MKKQKPFKLRKGVKKGPRGTLSAGLNISIGQDNFPEGQVNPYIIVGDEIINLFDDRLDIDKPDEQN